MGVADRPRRVRAGDAGLLPGRADHGLRLAGALLRGAAVARAPAAAGRGRARRRRRGRSPGRSARSSSPAAACSIPRRRPISAAFCGGAQPFPWRRPRRANRRFPTTIRSTSARSGSPARARPTRVAAEADVRARGGHAAAGLHHRIVGSVRNTPICGSSALNVAAFDAGKHGALPLVADANGRLAPISTRRWPAGALPGTSSPERPGWGRTPSTPQTRRAANQTTRFPSNCRSVLIRGGGASAPANEDHGGGRRGRAAFCPSSWQIYLAGHAGLRKDTMFEYGYSTIGLRDRRRAGREMGAGGGPSAGLVMVADGS